MNGVTCLLRAGYQQISANTFLKTGSGSLSSPLPVKAPSTETAVPAQATAHARATRGLSLVGGTHYDAERRAQGKLLLREYFFKDLEGPDSPLSSKKLAVCTLYLTKVPTRLQKSHSHCENELK